MVKRLDGTSSIQSATKSYKLFDFYHFGSFFHINYYYSSVLKRVAACAFVAVAGKFGGISFLLVFIEEAACSGQRGTKGATQQQHQGQQRLLNFFS